jgi:hypothetical protein
MNPQTLILLMNTASQLIILIEQLKSGVISDGEAWAKSKSDFDSAVSKWNAAISPSNVVGVSEVKAADSVMWKAPEQATQVGNL